MADIPKTQMRQAARGGGPDRKKGVGQGVGFIKKLGAPGAAPISATFGAVSDFSAVFKGKFPRRISKLQAGVMLTVAILIDLLQLLLEETIIVPTIINILAAMGFWLWFVLNGVSYAGGKKASKKLTTFFAVNIIELIPVINALPALTTNVAMTNFYAWQEDLEKHRENLAAQAAAEEEEAAQAEALEAYRTEEEAADLQAQAEEETREALAASEISTAEENARDQGESDNVIDAQEKSSLARTRPLVDGVRAPQSGERKKGT